MRLRKSILAGTAVALVGALSACGDPITGGVTWYIKPAVSQRLTVNPDGQHVLHIVLNQPVLLSSYPPYGGGGVSAGVAIIVYPGSSFREDCTFDVPDSIKLPVPLSGNSRSGTCTLILATGSGWQTHHDKVYVARGKADGVYAKLPSLSGSGSLLVRPAAGGQSDDPTTAAITVTAQP